MKKTNSVATFLGKTGSALGRGIMAGAAGTLAITISQMIEMKLSKRKPSTTPAKAASKVLHVKEVRAEYKEQFSNEVHWAYGTTWGVVRGLLSLVGVKKVPATALHFSSVYATALVMLPAIKVAPPIKKWGAKTIALDALHHSIYALVAGVVYDAIDNSK